MDFLGTSNIFVVCSFLSVCLLFSLVKFLQRVYWKPIYLQKLMRTQGIQGPSYRFIYGNTEELLRMEKESLSRPMEGLSHYILPKVQPHFYSWFNKYGRSFLFWNGTKVHYVTMETEFVKDIMTNKEKSFSKDETRWYLKKLLGDGLARAEGEKWARLQKIANQAFHADSLKNMTPAMIVSVEMMLERWNQREGKEIEVYEELKLLTSEVISRTAFGSSYREGKDVFVRLSELALMVARNAFRIRFPGLSKFYKTRDEIEAEELEKEISKQSSAW